jgi:uncharacterized membrane protein
LLVTFWRRGGTQQDIVAILIIAILIIVVYIISILIAVVCVLTRGDKVNYLHLLGVPGGVSPKDLATGGGGWTELDLATR